MATEQVRIDLVADDKASKKIDDVSDAARDLEKLSPEVEVTADTDQAERGIEQVADDARALSRADTELIIRAKIDAAKAELATLRAELDQTSEKAQTTARDMDRIGGDPGGGIRTRGNAIADLTGPLGEASGAASDFAGVFDGIGDIAEDVASKIGLSQGATQLVSQAVGGLGIAVAGAAAIWSIFNQRAQKARQEAEKVAKASRDISDALEAGEFADAAAKIEESFGGLRREAEKAGISSEDFAKFITGLSDEIPGTADRLGELTAAADAYEAAARGAGDSQALANTEAVNAAANYENLLFKLNDARDAFIETNGEADRNKAAMDGMAEGMRDASDATDRAARAQENIERKIKRTDDALSKLRDGLNFEQALLNFETAMNNAMTDAEGQVGATAEEVLALKESILDLGETAKTNPAIIASQIEAVDSGDLEAVRTNVQSYYERNPIPLATRLTVPRGVATGSGTGGIVVPNSMPLPDGGAPSVTNVYQTLPRGWRGDPLADAERAARRSGGLYRRSRR
ncbi:MAG TPA: hypothetical protein VIX41_08845 [Acidimicrobiales bacterium]